jgi:hypothetical protein
MGWEHKEGSLFDRLFAALIGIFIGCGAAPAAAQPEDLSRGKTPAQLFASDCADCHRNPQGLAKTDVRSLTGFLRVHYTSGRESAAALAEYLLSFASRPERPARPPAPSAGKPATAPANPQ